MLRPAKAQCLGRKNKNLYKNNAPLCSGPKKWFENLSYDMMSMIKINIYIWIQYFLSFRDHGTLLTSDWVTSKKTHQRSLNTPVGAQRQVWTWPPIESEPPPIILLSRAASQRGRSSIWLKECQKPVSLMSKVCCSNWKMNLPGTQSYVLSFK